MSDLVGKIINAVEAQCAKSLPSFSKLKYVYDIEKNDFKSNSSGYGVVPVDASSQVGVTRAVTVDQVFQVVVTDNYIDDGKTDSNLQSKVKTLYDKMFEIVNDLYMSKMGLPSIVLLATLDGIEAPEVFSESKVVALRMNMIIRYRQNLS